MVCPLLMQISYNSFGKPNEKPIEKDLSALYSLSAEILHIIPQNVVFTLRLFSFSVCKANDFHTVVFYVTHCEETDANLLM